MHSPATTWRSSPTHSKIVLPRILSFLQKDRSFFRDHAGPRFCETKPALGLAEVATEREAQSCADFAHSQGTQVGHAPRQSILGNGNRLVQAYCAWPFHAVLLSQNYLRGHITNRGCDSCDGDGRQISNGAVASEHKHGPLLVRRSKLVESDVAPGYSAGHAASASQTSASSDACGCLE